MESTRQNAPIPDKKFDSIERMRTNVLDMARERGLEIQGKINNHFNELLKKEKRKIVGKEVKSAARQFRRRRKQTEADVKKEIRDARRWRIDIAKEEKRRRKEVLYWKEEASRWKKENRRLKRNLKAREKRAEVNRKIAENRWRGKKKYAKLQAKVGDELKKIWEIRRSETLKPVLAKHAIEGKVKKITKELKRQSEGLDWEETEFPTPINDIKKFEKNNDICINVFSGDDKTKVYPIRVSGKANPKKFFSSLTGEDVSGDDYRRAQKKKEYVEE
ncbi:Hypothetical predicted protein [Paramuricea clavata]|uniref:Uncharacterized protein n=1 Tax=Paramuricea clavata TaxID=317549 RepID=A0A7D9JTP9_PARCT|nr:Hypothetical predicted protein [Paramuricea clavata]